MMQIVYGLIRLVELTLADMEICLIFVFLLFFAGFGCFYSTNDSRNKD